MNKSSRRTGGYTILEVVIVLTVSSILFAASVVGYVAQNRRTQFTESVNDFAQDIQDILNDVEVGFYPSNNSFSCTTDTSHAGHPYSPGGASQQGTNTNCIFAGKAIQFAPSRHNGTRSDIDIFTMVGRRQKLGTDDPAVNIKDIRPALLDVLSERKSLISGLEVSSVRTGDGTSLAGIAMVSSSSASGGVSTGLNNRASLAAIRGGPDETDTTFNNGVMSYFTVSDPIALAKNGVNICVKEGGTGGRKAVIQLAAGESQIIVNTYIDKPCP
ncbi:MAG TPA: type II secretion system protein [Candidatus Saccharimonadales bacterium]|nr:type II secretion system protein [Candidatus Saccharimonadales bacterium]